MLKHGRISGRNCRCFRCGGGGGRGGGWGGGGDVAAASAAVLYSCHRLLY